MVEELVSSDQYWATLPNEELVGHLVQKRRQFARMMIESGLLNRISRNWRYYHGLYFEDRHDGLAIAQSDEDSSAMANVNHFRSLIDQYITYVVNPPPTWAPRSLNNDFESREQTILFRDLLESYMEIGGAENDMRRGATHAMVMASGLCYVFWNQGKGKMIRPDVSGGMISSGSAFWEGDLDFRTPTLFDVAWDYSVEDYEDIQWIQVKTLWNRWDLAALYPEKTEEILHATPIGKKPYGDYEGYGEIGLRNDMTDMIPLWEFWHLPTPGQPLGRHLAYIDDKHPLATADPEPNEYEILPVARITPSEFILTCMGYTSAFDMQVPQELYGANMSTMLSDLNIMGQPRLFVHEDSGIAPEDLEPGSGSVVLKGRMEPKVLDFKSQIKDLSEALQVAKTEQELMSGIGPVSRGSPTGELKGASGTAFALLDSKSYQSTSVFAKRYREYRSRIGTIALKILQRKAQTERVTALAGKENRQKLIRWSADSLSSIDRVVVEPGNPLQKSLSGRVQIADSMATQGWISTPQEYLTVVETGDYKPLVSAMEAQLNVIADENQRLRENYKAVDGLIGALELANDPMLMQQIMQYLQQIGVVCMRHIDNHILHIRRHTSNLDSSEVRMIRGIVVPNQAHLMEHFDAIMDPEIQKEQLLLGYITGQQLQEFLMQQQIMVGPPMGAPAGMPAEGQGQENEPSAPNPLAQPDMPGANKPSPPKLTQKSAEALIGANMQ